MTYRVWLHKETAELWIARPFSKSEMSNTLDISCYTLIKDFWILQRDAYRGCDFQGLSQICYGHPKDFYDLGEL